MASAYDTFVEREGVPVVSAFALDNLADIEVVPWERIGGYGCYVHLDGRGPSNSLITEIPPGKELKEQRHFYEESVFVVEGSGRTELWNDSGFQVGFNWERGAVFAIPLNVHFKHINRSDNDRARLFSMTNQPLMMNLTRDADFIFGLEHDFDDRFNPEITDFTKPAQSPGPVDDAVGWRAGRGKPFVGNLVQSAYDVPLPPAPDRGANGGLLTLNLANSAMASHISEFPARSYKKGHRHGPGAHVIILNGTGYSLLWLNNEEPRRVDWQPGCVVVPPNRYFHQHFNSGSVPARYLALRLGGGVISESETYGVPTRDGGDQIEYEDEDPRIKKMFDEAVAAAGGASAGS